MSNQQSLSIRNLSPLERGGVEARKGFEFQDHIAAGFLIDLLVHSELLEVWCETHDDITLIWQETSDLVVEFVQVKALALNQL
ncbi:dsDNA nuclease domain-containing protein [Gimesia sp.]|uniref:dsDNA nuclease domain-containing protein n=1 Tax=Gimesia sp. TaxID=2024833 RepID=UPI00341FA202|tara:strand:+ start:445 stop:693 length:249 start_codon:yes stop_codon:yes gene_type:complete